MNQLLARIDKAADALERSGNYVLAAVLDNVSEQLEQRAEAEEECAFGTCADGTCADEAGGCADGTAAVATASLEQDASSVLTNNAGRVFESVKRYGAKSYQVDGKSVEVRLDREGVDATAEFQFCSRDEAGRPQLRLTFRCGDDKMVRWASLANLNAEELVVATTHVFGTGENYGAQVVTASAGVDYQLVDSIEQAVHDASGSVASLRSFSTTKLREAVAHLDAWTARIVKRYLAR